MVILHISEAGSTHTRTPINDSKDANQVNIKLIVGLVVIEKIGEMDNKTREGISISIVN